MILYRTHVSRVLMWLGFFITLNFINLYIKIDNPVNTDTLQ